MFMETRPQDKLRTSPVIAMDGDRIMPLRDAAWQLNVSQAKLNQLIRAGVIRRVVLPGRARASGVSARSVQALIDGGSTPPTGEAH